MKNGNPCLLPQHALLLVIGTVTYIEAPILHGLIGCIVQERRP
jgi:hypothetical protein